MDTDNQFAGAFAAMLRPIVVEAVKEALACRSEVQEDRMLSVDEAAKMLGVSKDFLYRYGEKLGLKRRIGLKAVRYSSKAIQRYIATRAC